jgi:hypothetical protein
MRMEDLSPAQRQLLMTDFGQETEKVAAEQAKIAQEMYDRGLDIAVNIANAMDAEYAAEKTAEYDAELEDPYMEKAAQQMGAFIERGQFDGLQKLGAERHGNEWFYILPFVEEKVAAVGARSAATKFTDFMHSNAIRAGHGLKSVGKSIKGTAEGLAKKTKEGIRDSSAVAKAKQVAGKVKSYHQGIGAHARQAATGEVSAVGGDSIKGRPQSILSGLSKGERAMEGAKAVGKLTPHAAAAGLAGALGVHEYKKRKDK